MSTQALEIDGDLGKRFRGRAAAPGEIRQLHHQAHDDVAPREATSQPLVRSYALIQLAVWRLDLQEGRPATRLSILQRARHRSGNQPRSTAQLIHSMMTNSAQTALPRWTAPVFTAAGAGCNMDMPLCPLRRRSRQSSTSPAPSVARRRGAAVIANVVRNLLPAIGLRHRSPSECGFPDLRYTTSALSTAIHFSSLVAGPPSPRKGVSSRDRGDNRCEHIEPGLAVISMVLLPQPARGDGVVQQALVALARCRLQSLAHLTMVSMVLVAASTFRTRWSSGLLM